MQPITNTKLILLAAGLALGAGAPAFAQTAAAPEAAAAQPAYGQLGANYLGLFYGYERPDQAFGPTDAHEYGALLNRNLAPGVDVNLEFDDQRGAFDGVSPRGDELLGGVTGYAPVNAWVKPFLQAQLGVAWTQQITQYSNGLLWTSHGDYFDSIYTAGAEFQVLPDLVVTPFAAYQEVHRFSHGWNYGVEATYRITRRWGVSLTPQIDQDHGLDYRAGVNFYF